MGPSSQPDRAARERITDGHRGPEMAYSPAPPAWLFYVLFAATVACILLLIVKAISHLARTGSTGGAQWGGAKVERKLAAPQDPRKRANRITAGRGMHTKKIVAAQPNISATVFGVPGSSKTTGLVLPNAAEWQGPLVVTTTKAADLDIIYARPRRLGPVWVIAPAGIPGRATQKWSPVDYCTDAKAADRMASWMAEASSSGDDKRAAPWIDQAKSDLKGVLLASNLSGGGARVYADEEVRETCAGTDFTVDDLLDENGTVCLIASEADAERLAPLLTSIIASIIHGAEVRYNATGKPLDPSLGVLVDEAGNMLRYPRLPNILTTGRGMGIDILTVWHDLSQLRERLGTQKANTVLSASGLRILLPGCGDLETLRYFSGLYGRTEVMKVSHGRSRGEYSTNTSATETDLAPVHSLQQLPDYIAIAQYSNQAPIKVRMRLTFRDKDLKRLLAAPVPLAATAGRAGPKATEQGEPHA
ncbi:type IV secretory system conjugative DNA transfer family protein [Streptomyces sp. SID7909]|uniref:type IV secretory system conjugative DNA transfer family protein n=1 Tax=Streptomyces sp. SID7909 TaxID=2706092 RepID=UPI001EF1F374|nr:type IV secretory system conjugative DNA transfer family protein [Streptomyces sp. SID7909]